MFPFSLPLQVGPWTWQMGPYTLFFGLAILLAMAGALALGRSRGLSLRRQLPVMLWMFLAALIGARLFWALGNMDRVLSDPALLTAMNTQGFSLYGGIFFALGTGYLLSRHSGWNPWRVADSWSPMMGVGVGTIRMGCFCHGCCFGIHTESPLGVEFPLMSPAHRYQLAEGGSFLQVDAVHPTQLYEMGAAFFLSAFAVMLLRRKVPEGWVTLLMLGGFSVARLGIGVLRAPTDNSPVWMYPLIYTTVFVVCSLLFFEQSRSVSTLAAVAPYASPHPDDRP